MAESARSEKSCVCTEDTESTRSPPNLNCECPRDHLDIAIHEETCLLYKNETIIYPDEPEECECPPTPTRVCECCACLEDQCHCKKAGREAFDEWRENRDVGAMPSVLESTHPLMQKFQDSLRRFLEKENELAEQQIIALKDELRLGKIDYEKELEGIYRSDHDTNSQRALIEEYEATLAKEAKAREEQEERARVLNEKYKICKNKYDQDLFNDRDSRQELDALTALVNQLEKWREETESDLTVSQRMSDKMRQEKQLLADEKRQLDMIIFGLSNEVWKLESRLELFKKQMEIKNSEMDKITDKVTAYATELEDLELDKKRMMSLWNSVLVNIKKRDHVYGTVRDDYNALQENYRTLMSNLEITKRINTEEMNRSNELAMTRDKLSQDLGAINKAFENEDERRQALEGQIAELMESIEMNERDQELIKMENQTMNNILTTTEKEYLRRVDQKVKMESEILANLQECLLNDKAVAAMASGIKKMRDMSRKLEISLMAMENQHAKMMLDIEVQANRQIRNQQLLEKSLAKVQEKEKELDKIEEGYEQTKLMMTRKQRELDIVLKKYNQLKDIFDNKSPQQLRIESMEKQIRALRDRTETLQHEWLRLQGHVVKLATQHQKLVADISLLSKQIQICDQKTMHIQANIETVHQERIKVERSLRDLRGRLEVLERNRKLTNDKNQSAQLANAAVTHEYTASLKGGEMELFQMEEEIEELDKEKIDLTQDLDRVQREALIWQRKGILAVELKRNIHEAKSAAGEIGQMKNEIHRMEVRREQLRRTAEKLSEDLALYVMRRETAMERTRATAAVEEAKGTVANTSQAAYHHKLRLAKADLARVTKELAEAKAQLEGLDKKYSKLQDEVSHTTTMNSHLEEQIANILRMCRECDRDKQWLLERVVRKQRLGGELSRAVKRQSLRLRKNKSTVLAEYNQAQELNKRLRCIVDTLIHEYPHLEDRLVVISNTLNIQSPRDSPRLTEDAVCRDEEGEPSCVMPSEEVQEEEVAEKPYCVMMP